MADTPEVAVLRRKLSATQAQLELAEVKVETLEERIRQLEELLFAVRELQVPVEFQLTGNETRLLGFLLQHELVSKEAAMIAMYSHKPDADMPELKIIDVYICKMRRKLKKWGIAIDTAWGRGYAMPAESKKIVREMSERLRAATAVVVPTQ